ncbi:MafI family immunity protein [Streptomyces sp. NPDC101225]|uniref:MafI family immunity protein n=1 Tax=Streptomyces sp. NPDC101225 TaxID=3366135 RepID=UPI0038309732
MFREDRPASLTFGMIAVAAEPPHHCLIARIDRLGELGGCDQEVQWLGTFGDLRVVDQTKQERQSFRHGRVHVGDAEHGVGEHTPGLGSGRLIERAGISYLRVIVEKPSDRCFLSGQIHLAHLAHLSVPLSRRQAPYPSHSCARRDPHARFRRRVDARLAHLSALATGEKPRDHTNSTGDTDAMTVDRGALQSSWNRTRGHLEAARVHLTGLRNSDLSATLEFLEHNELGLAFESLVDLGGDLDLPLAFWQHLDRAAREMRLYSDALHTPHLTAADLCRRHLAAAWAKTHVTAPDQSN